MYSKEEKKQLILNFWTGFTMYCSRMKYLNGRRKKWMLHRTKVINVHFKFDPSREGVQVILEVMHRSEDARLEMFQKLEQCKSILERGFENGLIWELVYERETGNEVSRIYTELTGVDLHRQADWEMMYEFMAENMYRFENNFLEIRDFLID